jgi:hypothetical protein
MGYHSYNIKIALLFIRNVLKYTLNPSKDNWLISYDYQMRNISIIS